MTCDAIEHDFSLLGGRVDETNQEVDNLQRQVFDLEGKLVKLAALEATFDHFTNEHWIPLQAVVRKLDLSHLCSSLNFLSFYVSSQFPSMFPSLTYFQSFLFLIC